MTRLPDHIVEKIKKSIVNVLREYQITDTSVSKFMGDLRKLIEATGGKDKYQHVKFYADWMAHSIITFSPVGYKILNEVTEIRISEWDISRSKKPISIWMADIFAFKELLNEIVEIADEFNLPELKNYFDLKTWQEFILSLISVVSVIPIAFANEKVTKSAQKEFDKLLVKVQQFCKERDPCGELLSPVMFIPNHITIHVSEGRVIVVIRYSNMAWMEVPIPIVTDDIKGQLF